MTRTDRRRSADRRQKVVYWSAEDDRFVGQCPALFPGGVHGDDEVAVFAQRYQVVEQHVAILRAGGNPPPASDVRSSSGTLTLRLDPALHRGRALRATAAGDRLTGPIERMRAESLA